MPTAPVPPPYTSFTGRRWYARARSMSYGTSPSRAGRWLQKTDTPSVRRSSQERLYQNWIGGGAPAAENRGGDHHEIVEQRAPSGNHAGVRDSSDVGTSGLRRWRRRRTSDPGRGIGRPDDRRSRGDRAGHGDSPE